MAALGCLLFALPLLPLLVAFLTLFVLLALSNPLSLFLVLGSAPYSWLSHPCSVLHLSQGRSGGGAVPHPPAWCQALLGGSLLLGLCEPVCVGVRAGMQVSMRLGPPSASCGPEVRTLPRPPQTLCTILCASWWRAGEAAWWEDGCRVLEVSAGHGDAVPQPPPQQGLSPGLGTGWGVAEGG